MATVDQATDGLYAQGWDDLTVADYQPVATGW
jgi:hypothetical protein